MCSYNVQVLKLVQVKILVALATLAVCAENVSTQIPDTTDSAKNAKVRKPAMVFLIFRECPDNAPWYMLLFAIVALIIAAILLRVGGSALRGTPVATIFNLVQISALFGGFNLNWPPALRDAFNVLSSINLNIDLFSPECSGN